MVLQERLVNLTSRINAMVAVESFPKAGSVLDGLSGSRGRETGFFFVPIAPR